MHSPKFLFLRLFALFLAILATLHVAYFSSIPFLFSVQKYIINNESEMPKRNIKKQEKFKKRRQGWNTSFIYVIK